LKNGTNGIEYFEKEKIAFFFHTKKLHHKRSSKEMLWWSNQLAIPTNESFHWEY